MRGWTVVFLSLLPAACAGREPGVPAPAPVAVEPPAPPILTGTLPGDRIPAFTAEVRRSGGALDAASAKGTRVLVVMSTRCPYCSEAVAALRRAEDAFRDRGVDFVYLYPMGAEPEEEKVAWHAAQGFRAGQVLDAGAAISRLLKADKTPTAFLVDARGVLLYRGAVVEADEGGGPAAHPLADALDEHLAGRSVTVPSTEPAG